MRWLGTLLLIGCTAGGEVSLEAPALPEPAPALVVEPPPPPLPVATEARYAATHVLIAWRGAAHAPASVHRTEPEARALAEELRARAESGESLDALARAYSDDPSAPRGGDLGVYRTGTMVPAFELAVAAVAPGALAPLVRTPFGWHVVRRDAVVEVEVAQVLIAFEGAHRASTKRTRAEAQARAESARAELEAGAAFGDVARRYSDGPEAARGGALGRIARGQMIPAFEEAAFALAVDEISAVVETPYGLHLIQRIR